MNTQHLFDMWADEPAGPLPADAAAQRKVLHGLLGDLPDRHRPLASRKIAEEEREGYVLEKLELDLNGLETVPAYFVRPRDARGPVPAILFNHSHGGGYTVGKEEFVAGRSYLQPTPYAKAITARGWAGLSILLQR